MRKTILFSVLLIVAISMFWLAASAQRSAHQVRARLTGYQETPSTLSTVAFGEFRGKINSSDTEMTYELAFENLEGSVTQAHIHFGAKGLSGGIMIWLCGTSPGNPGPAGTPACPTEGVVTSSVTAADVIGPAGQGISAGEFAEALQAMRSEMAYANVHSAKYPGGEIRGQIQNDNN